MLTTTAKNLRKNQTRVEAVLWNRLRAKQIEGIKFRRQQSIESFIVDFVRFEKRIIIEVDGGQHAEKKQRDLRRDKLLIDNGFKVLRFWNNDVLDNIDGVLEIIPHPPLYPLPSREGNLL
jgi:very-short-patch-repair endonuclease